MLELYFHFLLINCWKACPNTLTSIHIHLNNTSSVKCLISEIETLKILKQTSYLIVFLLFLGKILIIGGGIANFTNVAATFKV